MVSADNIEEKVTVQYFGCVVEVYKIRDPMYQSCPWRFDVTHNGAKHSYAGVPNYCETKRVALKRAWWRAKWFSTGEYNEKYQPVYKPEKQSP